MTPEIALKKLYAYATDYDNEMPDEQAREARKILANIIEKQIPKKPEESYDGYADGYAVIDYHCPNCGREIDETDHHCICGQAIDWSKENG